tara:strand:+ start:13303 stop:13632 length:330 start_codon:yes stop_codon:yes gene_type:complete
MSSQTREEYNAYKREYYEENKEYLRACGREWYKRYPETRRKYYQTNKEYIIKRNTAYQKHRVKSVEQKQTDKDYQKSYYQRNKERLKEEYYMKKYVDIMSDFILSLETF